ncbi:MAG: hypothetical protein ACYCSB_02110 [bacterium]
MLILELCLFAAEILFAVYLCRKHRTLSGKEKEISKQLSFIQSQRKSLKLQEEILKEDFTKDLEERKNFILDEFKDRLCSYHRMK